MANEEPILNVCALSSPLNDASTAGDPGVPDDVRGREETQFNCGPPAGASAFCPACAPDSRPQTRPISAAAKQRKPVPLRGRPWLAWTVGDVTYSSSRSENE